MRDVALSEGVLYSVSWDNTCIAWDARMGQELARYAHPDGVLCLGVMDDVLFTGCWDGIARGFDVRTGDELLSFKHDDGVRPVPFV